jgi:hypothetical protein
MSNSDVYWITCEMDVACGLLCWITTILAYMLVVWNPSWFRWTTRIIWTQVWEFDHFSDCFCTCALIIWTVSWHTEHLIFHQIKVSQMMNWSAPSQRAHRDDQNEYIICYIWSLESRVINSASKLSWEESSRHEKACRQRWGPPTIGAGRPIPP